MSNEIDWEKRARELLANNLRTTTEAALQLGREMVAEALKSDRRNDAHTLACMDLCRNAAQKAADARAEEIAKKIDQTNPRARDRSIEEHMAEIARSTIAKPLTPNHERLMRGEWPKGEPQECAYTETWIRADERAKIIRDIDAFRAHTAGRSSVLAPGLTSARMLIESMP